MEKRFNKVGFIFGKFINSFVEGGFFVKFPQNQLTSFVISNSLIDWSNKQKIKEEFSDNTYNYFVELKSPYNYKWVNWWKNEIIRNNYIVYKEEDIECCVCMDKKCNVETMCGHSFCENCLKEANKDIELEMFKKCPLCRETLSKRKSKSNKFYKEITNEPFTECICNKRYFGKNSNQVHFCGNHFIGKGDTCYICKKQRDDALQEYNVRRFIDNYNVYIDSDNQGYYVVDNVGQEFYDITTFLNNGHFGSDYGNSDSEDSSNELDIETLDFVVEGGLEVSVIDEDLQIS